MKIIKTKDLLVIETEKKRHLEQETMLEEIPLLEEDLANATFQIMEKDSRIKAVEDEQAAMTYLLMEKGVL